MQIPMNSFCYKKLLLKKIVLQHKKSTYIEIYMYMHVRQALPVHVPYTCAYMEADRATCTNIHVKSSGYHLLHV